MFAFFAWLTRVWFNGSSHLRDPGRWIFPCVSVFRLWFQGLWFHNWSAFNSMMFDLLILLCLCEPVLFAVYITWLSDTITACCFISARFGKNNTLILKDYLRKHLFDIITYYEPDLNKAHSLEWRNAVVWAETLRKGWCTVSWLLLQNKPWQSSNINNISLLKKLKWNIAFATDLKWNNTEKKLTFYEIYHFIMYLCIITYHVLYLILVNHNPLLLLM